MDLNLAFLLAVFVCVGSYKTTTQRSASNEENSYSLLITNQSYDVPSNDLPSNDQADYQRKSSTSVDDTDVRSEALIKKIHPFVYPKLFNTIEGLPNHGSNTSNQHLMEIRGDADEDANQERLDETLTPPDQKNTDADLIPLSTHLFERPPPPKHALQHLHYGYFDRPTQQHHSILPQAPPNNCLLGLLHGCDPLMLLGVLGFLAYVINAVLGLVNRLPPLLTTTATTTETTINHAATAAAAAVPKISLIQYPNIDERTVESNQKLLRDFERILQMAIEIYEQKIHAK